MEYSRGMKLILITSTKPTNPEVVDLIIKAGEARSYRIQRLDVDRVSINDVGNIETTNKDILYREALGDKARAIEGHFILRGDSEQPANLRRKNKLSIGSFPWDDTVRHQSSGIAIIPTIYLDSTWVDKTTEEINTYINNLGGFPVILKRTGLSHGQGVQLVNNSAALQKLLGENGQENLMNFVLRRYLKNYEHARLIILGDKVVGSINYEIPTDDFRTNAHEGITVSAKKYSDAINSIAVEATKVSGVEFGGADVLIDLDTNTPYLAELNFPCNFARAQMATNTDIAGLILDHLKNSGN